ncbi:MAG: carboxypeptidase-like regulatory domain-containing protein [Candidatus Acidiferrales bacterium]
MSLRAIRCLSLAGLVCLSALSLAAAPEAGKIAGVVVDPAGTPQMGATVVVSPEQLLSASPIQLLTNDHGRFSTAALPAGLYSIKVTLAGFLPAMEQHIQVDGEHATLLQIVLGSVFSSFEKLRRPADQQVAADDWTWVLRSAAANRAVLRWQDVSADPAQNAAEGSQTQPVHARLDLTSGADHPGSVSDLADSPATDFVYGIGVGAKGQVLMAGQFSYEDASSAAGLAAEWLPSGDAGVGPATTLLVRESRLGPAGPVFRGLRMSHDDQFSLGDLVSIRYGAEYLMAGFNGTTSALRPRGEVAVQVAPGWETSLTVAARPWQNGAAAGNFESALQTLDALPTLLVRNGRPVFENGLHEEIAVNHALNQRADLSAAVFHDVSTHTAVMGRGGAGSADFLQDYFSEAFAYDGGSSSSTGARLAYRQKIADNLSATVVYSYAGALAPTDDPSAATLRDQLATRYRHSVAARATTTIPRLGTKLTAGYKWLSGPVVSQQDPYGESLYHLDPYLSMEVRQPLPNVFMCRVEVEADMGNLLAQGYVPVATGDGSVVLVPSYRFFRGGLSLQF